MSERTQVIILYIELIAILILFILCGIEWIRQKLWEFSMEEVEWDLREPKINWKRLWKRLIGDMIEGKEQDE